MDKYLYIPSFAKLAKVLDTTCLTRYHVVALDKLGA